MLLKQHIEYIILIIFAIINVEVMLYEMNYECKYN